MEALFLHFLNMSITASWLILAVILLRVLLKKAPKFIRCILWGLVGIRLVLPFSIESVLSLIPSANTIPREILDTDTPAIDSGISAVDNIVNPVITDTFSAETGASVNPLEIVTLIASILWIVGIICMVTYGVISYIKLCRKVRASINVRDNVYYCDDISTPFILGIIKPRIYLPSGITENQADYVIAHENAHIKRRDHWWKPFGFTLLSVYWFNPLIWIAYVLLCRDIEMACDEKVIKNMDNAYKAEYSDALVECSTHQRRMIMACPLSFGEVGVKDRIKSVLSYKKPALWIIIVAIVACIGFTVTFLTNPATVVNVESIDNGIVYCLYYETNTDEYDVNAKLSESDLKKITEIFNGKKLHYEFGTPSCGFDKNFSVILDGKHYCIANDSCEIVYLAEYNKYFTLSKKENYKIRKILDNYGFSVPYYKFERKKSKSNLKDFYTLTYDDENNTYSYEIRDKFGKVILEDKNVKSTSVTIEAISDTVLKRRVYSGPSTAAVDTIYCDVNSGRASVQYYGVLAEYENKVIYWSNPDGKNLRLIVRDFFDKDVFYKEVYLGYTEAIIEPISDIKINKNIAIVTYIRNDWKTGETFEETITIDLNSTENSYNQFVKTDIDDLYSYSYDEETGITGFEIRDLYGNVLLKGEERFDVLDLGYEIKAISDTVLKWSDGGEAIYCDVEKGIISNSYFQTLHEYKNNVLYYDNSNPKDAKLVVRDIFDKDILYKEMKLGKETDEDPIYVRKNSYGSLAILEYEWTKDTGLGTYIAYTDEINIYLTEDTSKDTRITIEKYDSRE